MYRPDKIMKAGTWADPDFNGAKAYNAHGRTAVIDMSAGTPAWRETAPMAFARVVPQPDAASRRHRPRERRRIELGRVDLDEVGAAAEIWNPDTETWTTVDALQNGRLYHSTALLLPDGRVLMAGGGRCPGATDQRERRDLLAAVPLQGRAADHHHGARDDRVRRGLRRDDAGRRAASTISLIRLPPVTHGFDQNQRFQFLSFTQGPGR